MPNYIDIKEIQICLQKFLLEQHFPVCHYLKEVFQHFTADSVKFTVKLYMQFLDKRNLESVKFPLKTFFKPKTLYLIGLSVHNLFYILIALIV